MTSAESQNDPPGVVLAPGIRVPESALSFSFVRSSGPGGQNVNKRATKAQLRVRVDAIPLADAARARLVRLARRAISEAGEIVIQDDSTRSAARNRRACLDRLREMIVRALAPPKQRRPTKPSRGSIQRRLDEKKHRGEAKRRRRKPDDF